jgi:hypothetical protein
MRLRSGKSRRIKSKVPGSFGGVVGEYRLDGTCLKVQHNMKSVDDLTLEIRYGEKHTDAPRECPQ